MNRKASSKTKTTFAAAMFAAMGLGALPPMQQAGVVLTGLGAAMWAAPALAGATIPGVGTVVKKWPGDAGTFIAPSDNDGVTRLTGLEPGEYEVKLFGEVEPVKMKVGKDGRLAFVAMQDSERATVGTHQGKRRAGVPVMRQWVEQIAFDGGRRAAPVESFDTKAAVIDVNTASVEQLMRGTNNSDQAAAFIFVNREKQGPYKNPLDFAQRVGGSVDLDFGYASLRIGDTTIYGRGGNPKEAGFKTVAGSGVVEVYGKKHNYVGHVTLLR